VSRHRSGALGMQAGDRVRHKIDGRIGTACEFLQDGDAYVRWDDGRAPTTVKWNALEPHVKRHPRVIIEALVTLVGLTLPKHRYIDEDTWYSCPKAPEGCADESQGNKCNCGVDEKRRRIRKTFVELGLDPDEIL